jgi:ribosomal protein L13
MTKLLDRAVERVLALPAEMQDQAARMLLVYAGDEEPVFELTPEEEADLNEALSEMARGELASEAAGTAILSKYSL